MAKKHRRGDPTTENPPIPESPQGLNIGLQPNPLPGGIPHLVNQPVADHQEFAKVNAPFYSGMMAHGVFVEPQPLQGGRTYPEGGRVAPNTEDIAAQQATKSAPVPEPKLSYPPIPVVIVEHESPGHPLTVVFTNLVPVTTGDPVMICARDPNRHKVYLHNEDAANDVRFSTEWPVVTSGGGAVLSHLMPGYLDFKCQERIYAQAIAGTNPVYVSVILETEINDAVP